jgi:hypothetical protein
MWQHCACGHDFGPTKYSRTPQDTTRSSGNPELEAQSVARWARPGRQFLSWLQLLAVVLLLLASPFHGLRWLTCSAAAVLAVLFWVPLGLPSFLKPGQEDQLGLSPTDRRLTK